MKKPQELRVAYIVAVDKTGKEIKLGPANRIAKKLSMPLKLMRGLIEEKAIAVYSMDESDVEALASNDLISMDELFQLCIRFSRRH